MTHPRHSSSPMYRAVASVFAALAISGCAVSGTETSPQVAAPIPAAEAQPQQHLWWFDAHGATQDARAVLAVLHDARSHGLNPEDYRSTALSQAVEQIMSEGLLPAIPGTPAGDRLAALDADLTGAVLRYLSDLHNGRLSPEVLSHRFKAPPSQSFDARAYLDRARQAGRLGQAVQASTPKFPMYEALRGVMNAYRAMGDHPAWQLTLPEPKSRSIKPGQPYDGLEVLAARLIALGDLSELVDQGLPAAASGVYEGELLEGVRRFQARHGLETDGVIGAATLAELNVTPAERVEQMALTLERLRWTPTLYGPRMIAINVPEFILRAYEQKDGKIELNMEMRVVVGRALNTQTPIFLEDMRFIEFSPYWNVPPSIARGETLPRLRRDPAYFDQQGFEFVTRDGKVISQFTEEGLTKVRAGEWRIRQRPGPRNALGDIKFIFPNDQNIYLHHTPAPALFARARRDFSHGCIRIEEPVELAQFVLRNNAAWSKDRIEAAMRAGKSSTLRLDEPIPVLIAYSTAVVKRDGKVYFFPDIYRQDSRLKQALQSARPLHS